MSTLPHLPYIPLEVAENIIDQLSRDVRSLRSCALTCRGWHLHARYLLMTSIRVRSREDLLSICDHIASIPRMARFVRSISVLPAHNENSGASLTETIPVDLLKRLPNLHSYSLRDAASSRPDAIAMSLHPTILICFRTYLHVQELGLGPLKFCTGAELARLLVALPRLQRLECTDLQFVDRRNIWGATAGATRFRDGCNGLSEVTVRLASSARYFGQ
ncbi:hypothetical protein K466DRAFT_502144 [Polyporus arcularius HHB13444]|uniref:F-box domain-containing protein n=1 Tax=Polyporus arcularius HHB13444 TaxID=1314778 RepID=A0A5C3NVS3_9APHY|nr:hypothetical protein K466DRAFT_502144 [Polyporus arcularius HHB13444]